jgi:heme-binding NEAT domain protein
MPFKPGDFIVQNNSNRMALVMEVNNHWLNLFWTDICKEITFPLGRAQILVSSNKWKYVET